jgi:predicted MPP superfamily phosphohydrolase
VWFIYLAIGLMLLVICGLYARRRLAAALAYIGAGSRGVRATRWLLGWLLFGYPILLIATVAISRLLGSSTLPRLDGAIASAVLALPFILTVLVVVQTVPWLVAIDIASAIAGRTRASRFRAIGTLVAFGAFALYTPIRVVAERDTVLVRHHAVGHGIGARPLRIAFLSDVHEDAHTDVERARAIYRRIDAEHPDLVLAGGDWISTGPDYIEPAAAAAATLTSRLGTYSVRGDHEHFAYVDRQRSVRTIEHAMEEHRIHMLANEVRWFEHAGKRIGVLFLDYNYIARADAITVNLLVAQLATADYAIVVTHQFDRALAAQLRDRVDLVLAGHTHGGQVNPVVGVTHVNLARIETPYVDGRYAIGKRTIAIVTSGIGMSVVPIRYAAPGSIEIIDLSL